MDGRGCLRISVLCTSFYNYDELNGMNLTRDREGMGREILDLVDSSSEYMSERSNSCFISERSAKSCPGRLNIQMTKRVTIQHHLLDRKFY